MSRIYLSPPELAGSELERIAAVLSSGWIAPLGPEVDAFEADVASYLAMPHALATSSGTAALHLALLALGVGPGDTVWTSSLTFAASANVIAYVGATPVFIDSELSTWNLDPALFTDELARAARTNQLPKAVIAVDLYGQCADLEPIAAACRSHGVWLIEDAAEALGATYRGRRAGSFGDLSILSFNGNKIITTSGGGMLLARSKSWIDRARHLATQAREPVTHYEHREVGYNYRLSNILAGVGRAQFADLERRVETRRAINQRYRDGLGDLPIQFMPEPLGFQSTYWLTCVTFESEAERDDVLAYLGRLDIEARPVWKPMHLQPAFSGHRVVGGRISEQLFRTGLCLPSGSSLTLPNQQRVIRSVREGLSSQALGLSAG